MPCSRARSAAFALPAGAAQFALWLDAPGGAGRAPRPHSHGCTVLDGGGGGDVMIGGGGADRIEGFAPDETADRLVTLDQLIGRHQCRLAPVFVTHQLPGGAGRRL